MFADRLPRWMPTKDARSARLVATAVLAVLTGVSVLASTVDVSLARTSREQRGRIALSLYVDRGDGVGDSDIHVMNADGTGLRNLNDSAFRQNDPAWSPDGRAIAFTTDSGLHLMRPDGSGERVISYVRHPSSGTHLYPQSPAWSPDGTRLVFAEGEWTGETYLSYSLVVISQDGSRRRIVLRTTDSRIFHLDWSPDGRWILFTDCSTMTVGPIPVRPTGSDDCEQHVVRPDGSDHISLTSGETTFDHAGSFGKDGRIYFLSNRSCEGMPLTECEGAYSMERDGSDVRFLAPDADWNGDAEIDRFTRIIPSLVDGSEFLVVLAMGPSYTSTDLWLWDLSSGSKRKLLSDVGRLVDWQTPCTLRGTSGPDTLVGTSGADRICGLGGDDTVYGRGGDDVIFGHAGDDVIDGGAGADIVVGNQGRDDCVRDGKDHSSVC